MHSHRNRAEYGLLSPLIRAVHEDPDMELQLLVTACTFRRSLATLDPNP